MVSRPTRSTGAFESGRSMIYLIFSLVDQVDRVFGKIIKRENRRRKHDYLNYITLLYRVLYSLTGLPAFALPPVLNPTLSSRLIHMIRICTLRVRVHTCKFVLVAKIISCREVKIMWISNTHFLNLVGLVTRPAYGMTV